MTTSRSRSIDAEIQAFTPLIESLAAQYSARFPNEYDDLRQEGMIAVWLAFERGQAPTEEILRWRMQNWMRKRLRQDHMQEPTEDVDELYLDDPPPGKSPVLGG